MAKFIFFLGLILIALPFVVMLLEVGFAHLTGATGEHMMAAGFWGVFVGFFTLIPGVVLLIIGIIGMLIEW